MDWLGKLKGAQNDCEHPLPHETSESLEGSKNKIYNVTKTRCRTCRKLLSEKKKRGI